MSAEGTEDSCGSVASKEVDVMVSKHLRCTTAWSGRRHSKTRCDIHLARATALCDHGVASLFQLEDAQTPSPFSCQSCDC